MKRYTIIGGVNGVGKSSLYGALTSDGLGTADGFGTIIDPDKIIARLGGDKTEGGKEVVRIIGKCLENGVSFTQETTLSGKKTVKTVLSAKKLGYRIVLYYIAVGTSDESVARIANRVRKGGHDIPEETVRRRFENRFDDLARLLPLVDEAVFFDNENGFVRVADLRGGKLTTGSYVPAWLDELKERLK